MSRVPLFLVVVTLLLAPAVAGAQIPISLNVYGGMSSPTGDFADRYASDGLAYGVEATLHFHRRVGIWLGWSRNAFACDVECPSDPGAHSSQTSAGLFLRVLDSGPIRPWVRLGGLKGTFTQGGEVVNSGTWIAHPFETDGGAGFDLSLGLDAPILSAVSVSPAIRYRGYTGRYELQGYGEADFDVAFLSFELGVRIGPFD